MTLTSGNWQVNMISTTNLGAVGSGGMSLSQTGTSVSGIMHLVSPPCFTPLSGINVNATVNGPTLQLTASTATGQTISVTATGSATSLTGSYTLGGTNCPQDQGAFTAILVPSATGSWHGTLTSTAGGPATQVTAMLTQSGPDAQGFFSVSGTVTLSGSCLSSGTVGGLAIGAGYALIVTPPSGEPVAISGAMTDPATANAFSGFYSSIASTCTDSGTASLTRP
ncbi:MAG TPA: hypothetical protein VI488_06830 [Candidatus Angelobacter sp.]